MYMNTKFLILVLILFCSSAPLLAQEVWSLDDCIEYALEHNLTINDFEYSEEASRESHRQSVRDLLPSISGYSDYNIQYGRSTDPNTNDITNTDFFSNNYSLGASIDIFRGFQKLNAIKAFKFLYKATQEEALQQKYLLAFRVMSAFYDTRFYEELLVVSKEQEAVSQDNYDLVAKQIELGMKAGADLYEAESQLLTDKLSVTQTENLLAAAKLTLIQEMNLGRASDINIMDDPVTMKEKKRHLEVDSDSIYKIARSFVPIIKSRELRTEAAKKQVAVAQGNLYPSLSFGAGYGTGYFETRVDDNGIIPFSTQIKDNASRYIGLSMNIPISEGWSRRSNIKQQKIEYLRAQNNLDLEEQELYQLIQQLVQTHESLKVEIEQSGQKVVAQELAFTIAQKKYERGLINALDLIQAQTLFATAQNENLQVKFKAKVNESTLDFYRGLPVLGVNLETAEN